MNRIQFGPTDLMVSPIGLGCFSMSGVYGAQDDKECIATIREAIDLGINLLDTSSNYGKGHNQRLIGEAIKGRRDEVVIHSKIGSIRPDGRTVVSGTPEHIRQSTEGGLKRLGIDCMDVICISRVDPNVEIEDTVAAMAQMIKEGKTRYIAMSKDASAEIVARASSVHPVVSLQDEYSLLVRTPEDELLGACKAHDMAFMAYAPLGRGLLAGLFHAREDIPDGDVRERDSRYSDGNFEHNMAIVERLAEVASEKGITVSALSLAWVMHQSGRLGGAVIPIPSSKTRAHLRDNAVAASVVLSDDDLARINEICPAGALAK